MPTYYHCERCGKRAKPEEMIFSTHTGKRYCTDLDRCARRAHKPGSREKVSTVRELVTR